MPINITDYINSLDRQYRPRARRAAVKGLQKFALFVLGQAQVLCPQSPSNQYITSPKTGAKIRNPGWTGHSGFLRSSATDTGVREDESGRISIEIGFNAQYAAAVHEKLEAFHKPPTRSKYLETAMNEEAPKMGEYLKSEIDKEFA